MCHVIVPFGQPRDYPIPRSIARRPAVGQRAARRRHLRRATREVGWASEAGRGVGLALERGTGWQDPRRIDV